jgi:hypothetical protein
MSALASAEQIDSSWKQEELTESFMRSLSKDECMKKTIASLKAGCTTEACLKTLAGITGDCTTWASGDHDAFCSGYDREYIAKYCATNELDGRRCMLLHVGKSGSCKSKTSDTRTSRPLEQ